MGNSSNWISDLKKVDFRQFQFFFQKIMVFQGKNEIFFSLILFVPKPAETNFRHNLHIFLPYKPVKTYKKAEKWHFWLILVIFGDFHCGLNLRCIAAPKWTFDPRI